MQFKKVAIGLCAVVCAVLVFGIATNAADVHSGTWKLNGAKSTFSPGPAAKSITLKIESSEKSYKVHSESVDGAGKATTLEFSAMIDGKDYPGTGLQSGAETVMVERVDANTMRVTMKKAGKAVMTVTSVVSADGKTRTSTFVGWDAEGHDVKNVVVYDKQ
jgi:cytoskeletal protein RodZ